MKFNRPFGEKNLKCNVLDVYAYKRNNRRSLLLRSYLISGLKSNIFTDVCVYVLSTSLFQESSFEHFQFNSIQLMGT